MNYEDKTWLNQSLLWYKDSYYNSLCSISFDLSLNTSDFKNFSALMFRISLVSQNTKKSMVYNISYQSSLEFLSSLKKATDSIPTLIPNGCDSSHNIEIVRRDYPDKNLKFEITRFNSSDLIVTISIVHNTSDSLKIIIPFNIFQAFCLLLKSFSTDYIKHSMDLAIKTSLGEILEQTKLTNTAIRILPSSLVDISKQVPASIQQVEDIGEAEFEVENPTINSDFNNFLNENIDSIKIEEIEKINKQSSTTVERKRNISGILFEDIIQNDLSRLEFLMNSSVTTPNPFKILSDEMTKFFNDKDRLLPDITDNDYKSFLFMSKVLHNYFFKRFIDFDIPIPSSIPLLKYKCMSPSQTNIEFAQDLLLTSIYLKCLRNKLSEKEANSSLNKSVLYMNVRLFTDMIIFSFIEGLDTSNIKGRLIERFQFYNEKGVFSKYTKLLSTYNLSPITSGDMKNVADEFIEKAIKSPVYVTNLQDQYFKTKIIRISSENDFSLEQIINEIIPAQCYIHNHCHDATDDDCVRTALDTNTTINIKQELLDIIRPKEIVKERKPTQKNLQRASNLFVDEIADSVKEKYFDYVANLVEDDNKIFDFNIIPIEFLGETILKVIYVWNEQGGITDTYSNFMVKVEECPMTRDLIEVKYERKNSVDGESSSPTETNWDSLNTLIL